MRPRRHLGPLPLLACAALTLPAAAGELELGGEGYAFTLRDTGYSVLRRGDPNSERPSFAPPPPLDLEGLGWRARAGLAFHDGAERVSVVAQRVRDDARDGLRAGVGDFEAELNERSEAALTTVDARYERRVTSSERFELRVQGGYRFARLAQSREITGACPVCRDLLGARFARLQAESRLTGHGMRAGLTSDVRLVGPLRFESEAGLSLLAATERNASNLVGLVAVDSASETNGATEPGVSAEE